MKLGVVFLSLGLISCASLRERDPRQVVLVNSEPGGARVFMGNQELGVTPALVALPRFKNLRLKLIHPKYGEKDVPLSAKYRWNESFLPNLVFFQFAPLGWLVDYYRDRAFELERPEKVRFGPASGVGDEKIRRLVIAPPQWDKELIADEMGVKLEGVLSQRGHSVIPYSETLEEFSYYGYDHDNRPPHRHNWDIYYHTRATHVFESKLEKIKGGFYVTGVIKSALTGAGQGEDVSLQFKSDEISGETSKSWGEWIEYLPNTFAFEFANTINNIEADGVTYQGVNSSVGGPWGEAAKIFGGLGLLHLDGPTNSKKWRPHFKLLPVANFRYNVIEFKRFPGLEGEEFERVQLGLGYGPQFGFRSRSGHFYINVVPGLGLSQLSFSEQGDDAQISEATLMLSSELGYNYYLGRQVVVRLFTRTVTENVKAWETAIERASGTRYKIDISEHNYSGLSIGYYFPTRRRLN